MSPLYCNDGTFLKSDTTIFHGEVDISDESLPHYKKNTRANECLIWLLLNVCGGATAAYKVIPSTPDPYLLGDTKEKTRAQKGASYGTFWSKCEQKSALTSRNKQYCLATLLSIYLWRA